MAGLAALQQQAVRQQLAEQLDLRVLQRPAALGFVALVDEHYLALGLEGPDFVELDLS